MITISTTAAIADADGSVNKPAKTNALDQPCLYTRDTLIYLPARANDVTPGVQLSADTKRPIGRFDLVHLLILLAGHKSKRTACRFDNNRA